MSTQSKTGSTYDFASDSEDELDWEEVSVPQVQHLELEDDDARQGPSTRQNIEVTLEVHPTRRKDGTPYAVFLFLIDERVNAVIGQKFRVESLTPNDSSASTVTRCIP
jgi:hypothetical protein